MTENKPAKKATPAKATEKNTAEYLVPETGEYDQKAMEQKPTENK